LNLKSREILFPSSGPGIIVWANSFYTRATGPAKMLQWRTQTRSDITDGMKRSFSDDNGCTWSSPETVPLIVRTPAGVFERFTSLGFVDPSVDRLVTMINETFLPGGKQPEDARDMQNYMYLAYQVSADGGKTCIVDEQVIQTGPYSPEHPMAGIWRYKNGIALANMPIRTSRGQILVGTNFVPLDSEGKPYNPAGAFSFEYTAVLIGTWTAPDRLRWDLSEPITIDPALSTRGLSEPDLTELPDGRILMVLRGSNEGDLPGYKWFTISEDGGYTWRPVEPWTYTDGTRFFSPSSSCLYLWHSNGRLYWFGNITAKNPCGNHPRHPLVVGQVDPESGLLIRDTVTTLLDRKETDHPLIQLSNFWVYEDRQTKEIIMHISPIAPQGPNDTAWTGDALMYRFEP
jgi:hypothetical protein